ERGGVHHLAVHAPYERRGLPEPSPADRAEADTVARVALRRDLVIDSCGSLDIDELGAAAALAFTARRRDRGESGGDRRQRQLAVLASHPHADRSFAISRVLNIAGA